MAAKLFRDNPAARVVMTGCGAEVDPERMAQSKGIHYVVGNRDKPGLVNLILEKLENEKLEKQKLEASGMPVEVPSELGEILGGAQGYEKMLSRHPMDRDWYLEEGFITPPVALVGHSAKTRAFLKIQEGCNAFCTYCIIPYGRGPSRSIKPGEVIRQVRELVAQGIQEVVITGTNVGDYGTDWDPTQKMSEQLVSLFRAILDQTDLKRLRVSSLDPVEITPELMSLMESNSRFCPHFHVSLQSVHSKILKLMKRKYGTSEVESCLEAISRLNVATGGVFVGMDIITGFPGETDEDFEQSYQLLSKLPWTRLHVFSFSDRKGTPATRLPGSVRQEVRVQRARRLNALSLERMKTFYEDVLRKSNQAGLAIEGVLLERGGSNLGDQGQWVSGYSSGYLRVLIPADQAEGLRNREVVVLPTEIWVDGASNEVALLGNLPVHR
jgi:MiaB/RimO family radical SAM methylthiotransferase